MHNYNLRKQLEKKGIIGLISIRKQAINSLDSVCYETTPTIRGFGNLKEIGKRYDAIVCGSDQVWNPDVIKPGYSSVEFITGIHKVAFSPSFGVSEIPEKMYPRYKAFLDDFSFLSSREESGAKLIYKITGREAQLTADPTLTLKREHWNRYCEYSKVSIPKEKYIFCYLLGGNEEHRTIIKHLQKCSNCKIVSMPHFKGYVAADSGFADIELYNVNPADFVKLIANAEYVCTDSFHGTVFSNIFQKKYFVFERYRNDDKTSTNTRIHSLLSVLGTKERLIGSVDELQKIYKVPIDYDEVAKKMDEIRLQTDKYLEEALFCVRKDVSNV